MIDETSRVACVYDEHDEQKNTLAIELGILDIRILLFILIIIYIFRKLIQECDKIQMGKGSKTIF